MNDDFLISKLIALCGRFADNAVAGRFHVATKAGLSEQYLYQIITNKPMANGRQRSVGKKARDKITRAFPDWLDGTPRARETQSANEPAAHYVAKPHDIRPLAQQVCDIVEQIDDDGLRELVGFARCLIGAHPRIKPKRA